LFTIALARARDLSELPAIELAAARLLAGHAPDSVLAETTSPEEMRRAHQLGHLWVALDDDKPVGFAHVTILEPCHAHLEEIDVHPDYGRQGIGKQLVTAVCAWAAREGYESVTLTTFRVVPFNMPFYASLGFEIIPETSVSAALRGVVADETRRGLDLSRRAVMRRQCRISDGQADRSI
jgi:GNAT superfamily N-acetyltransferase